MFDKIKQMKQLMDLQNQLKQEKTEAEKNGVKAVVNGKMEVELIMLNPNLSCGEQEKLVKECVNEAMHKMQMAMAMKMSQMPGFGL